MRYKISYFDQTHSTLYIRSLVPGSDGLFDCFVFFGIARICMQSVFELQGIPYSKSKKEETHQIYEINSDSYVECTEMKRGRCLDFPKVEHIKVTEWTVL